MTVLAVLAAISGLFGLLGAFGIMALSGAFLIIGLFLLVLSVAYLVFAWGAWTLQSWGWTLGVTLAAASIVLTLLQLVQNTTPIVSAIISIAISAVILYYLFRPEVKAAFGRS